MKHIIKLTASIGLASLFFLFACDSKNENNMDNDQVQSPKFATSAEAVAKGKSDLIEILRSNKNNGLNLKLEQVEKSSTQESITTIDVNFQQFLKSDSLTSFREIIQSEKGRINALYNDNELLTTIHTRVDSGAWSVASISDKMIEAEISELRNSNQIIGNSDIVLYEIPNIDAHVYSIQSGGSELFYTNYKGNSLSKPIALNELVSMLREDAMAFQREFGERLAKEKLVK